MSHIKEREISALSGGELQRFACAMVCIQNGDIFMFDEPSSYLDVKQRLNAAQTIRSLLGADRFIIVVEHDLSVLDYLSDFICCLYGVPGAYGVVTMPFSVREGTHYYFSLTRMKFKMIQRNYTFSNFYFDDDKIITFLTIQ